MLDAELLVHMENFTRIREYVSVGLDVYPGV